VDGQPTSHALEFFADCFSSLSLSPKWNDPFTIFVGMVHNGSPSLHIILEEFADLDDTSHTPKFQIFECDKNSLNFKTSINRIKFDIRS
jgi:hypothetical protein